MTGAPTSASWQPDPTGRHLQRYFDGKKWTDHVADGAGNASIDPLTQPAVGPEAGQVPHAPVVASWHKPTADFGGGIEPTAVARPGLGPNQAAQVVQPVASATPSGSGWSGPTETTAAKRPGVTGTAAAPLWGAPPSPIVGGPSLPVHRESAGIIGRGPATAGSRDISPIGLIGALIGLALLVMGIFALKWFASPHIRTGDVVPFAHKATLSDIRNNVTGSDVFVLTRLYFQWGVYVALGVAVVLSVLAALVRKLAAVGVIAALLAAAWHFWAVFDYRQWTHAHWLHAGKHAVSLTLSVQAGVWLAGAGFVVCALASLISGTTGSRRSVI